MKKNLAITLLIASSVSAVKISKDADVFGPNGEDYENDNAEQDMADFGVDITKKGKGQKCQNGAWTTVSWKGYLNDGRVITDSSLETADGRPKTFNLGADEVFKCWDLALPQLTKGTKATLHCPAKLVYGSAKVQSPLGDDWIPKNSDIDFDIEVVDCNVVPTKEDFDTETKYAQPKSTTMQSDECMILHLVESDNTGFDLVLSTQEDDHAKEWPAKWALIEQYVKDDESQQWYFNEDDGSIYNAANPDYRLDEHQGWLMVANINSKSKSLRPEFPRTPRKWFYEQTTSALTTDIDGIDSSVAIWGQPQQWAWAEIGPTELLKTKASSKFRIEYCYINK